MAYRMIVTFAVGLVLVATAAGQSTTTGSGSDIAALSDSPPAENATGSAVRQRAPGLNVQAALARHNTLRDARLSAQRTQATADLAHEDTASSGGSSTSGLSGLLNTVLNSGLLGSAGGNLGSSISGLLGSTGTTTGGTSTTTGNSSGLPQEVLDAIAAAGITLKGLNSAKELTQPAEPVNKTFARMQTTTGTEETKFRVRWADAMMSTFFTAISVGFQTSDFVDALKDFWRGILIPDSANADATDGT